MALRGAERSTPSICNLFKYKVMCVYRKGFGEEWRSHTEHTGLGGSVSSEVAVVAFALLFTYSCCFTPSEDALYLKQAICKTRYRFGVCDMQPLK